MCNYSLYGSINTLSSNKIIKSIPVSFSDGNARVTINGVPSNAKVFISRQAFTASSLILAAQVTATDTVSMSAWNADTKETYTGTITVCLLFDFR